MTPQKRWLLPQRPQQARILILMLALEAVILIGLAAFSLLIHRWMSQNGLLDPSVLDLAVAIEVTAILIAFGVSAVMTVLISSTVLSRVREMGELVEKQIENGDLGSTLTANAYDDEIGYLTDALNRLTHSYRESLTELAEKATEMETLNKVAATINRTFDLQEVLDLSLQEVLHQLGFPKGAIYMWDDRSAQLNMVSFVGLSEDTIRKTITLGLGEGFIGRVAATGQPMEVGQSPEFLDGPAELQVAMPLRTPDSELLGVLTVGGLGRDLMQESRRKLLITLSYQMALAIDKARLYDEVRRHNEELEKRVEARTQQLNRAVEKLSEALEKAQEADRIKAMLLSTVSHELRTPLATIKGNTSLISGHFHQLDGETVKQHLQDIEDETDKLTALITDLLDMSRLEAGMLTIDPHPLNMAELLQNAINAARVRATTHTFKFEEPNAPLPPVNADWRRIDQVLSNLLNNAVKYSPEGSTITASIRVDKSDGCVVVAVADEGYGIEEQHLENIFDRFYQISNMGDSGRYGVGLGLSICRGLIESHGGRIWVESEAGSGSTFIFSLPAADVSLNQLEAG